MKPLNATRYTHLMKTIQRGRTCWFGLVITLIFALFGMSAMAQDGQYEAVSHDFTGEATPALFSVGLATGFPTYQAATIAIGAQMEFVGVQLKGGYTVAGAYFGAQVRGYPPFPIPMPVYFGVGGGVYGSNNSFHIAVGTHIPVTNHLRIDLEAGIANVPLLNERTWAPHIAAGVSYTFAVETAGSKPSPTTETVARESVPVSTGSCEATDPNLSQVPAVVQATIDDMILSARATYGSTYTDLQYNYFISDVKAVGSKADVTIDYSGSVRKRLGGGIESASGDAGVALSWTGCGWRAGDVWY